MLFLASNPSADEEAAPFIQGWVGSDSSDDEIFDASDGAFEPGQRPGIADGIYMVDPAGHRGTRGVRYWIWARARARELFGRDVSPGHDYAITEVVHCGSRHEAGVSEAFGTCVDRYLLRVLTTSPASVIICVGDWAAAAIRDRLGVPLVGHLYGPSDVAGRRRWIVSVPHPGAYGTPKGLVPYIRDEIESLRAALKSA